MQAAQIRAARALLGWRQEDLAKAAKVGLATIARIEQGEGWFREISLPSQKFSRPSEREGISFYRRIGWRGWSAAAEEVSTRLVWIFTKRSQNYLLDDRQAAGLGVRLVAREDLARETALSVATIRRAELAEDETSMTAANDLAVRRALEMAGVEFIDENGGGPVCDCAIVSGQNGPNNRPRRLLCATCRPCCASSQAPAASNEARLSQGCVLCQQSVDMCQQIAYIAS